MKKTIFVIVMLILLFLPACSKSEVVVQDTSKITTSDEIQTEPALQSEPTESPIELLTYKRQKLPPVEPITNASAIEFLSQLNTIVADKDLDALIPLLASGIKSSFGGDESMEDFYRHWGLNENPEDTLLWDELEEVLSFEAYVDESNGHLILPCYFWTMPDNVDGFLFWYIREENVPVYELPDFNSNILDYYSNEIIAYNSDLYDLGDEDSWMPVIMSDGTPGYVEPGKVRCQIDYRLLASYINGKWIITTFIAGD